MTWKVRLSAPAIVTLSELRGRYTTLKVPEINGTRGLPSSMTVRRSRSDPCRDAHEFPSERNHILGPDLHIRPSAGGGRSSSTRRGEIALNESEGPSRESVGRLATAMEIDRLQ